MKTLNRFAFGLLCLVAQLTYAQTTTPFSLPTDEAGNVQFQQVVKLNRSESVQSTIGRVRTWVDKTYNSDSTVVQQYDPQQGILIVSGLDTLSTPLRTYYSGKTLTLKVLSKLYYILKIEAQAGQYRSTINSLQVQPISSVQYTKKVVVAKPPSFDESYQALATGSLPEETRRKNAELNVENQTAILGDIQYHLELLLKNLEKGMN